MTSRAITKKRSRAQFNEDDELALEVEKTPLSNAKRKKSNNTAASTPNGSVFGSIRKKFGNFLGIHEQGKENTSADEDEDELADAKVTTPSRKKVEKDIFDVPSSPEEERRILARSGGVARLGTGSSLKKGDSIRKGSASKQRGGKSITADSMADIFDVPNAEPTPGRGRKPIHSVEKAKAHLAPVIQQSSSDTPKRKPGRPRKSDILKHAKQLSNKAAREQMMAEKAAEEEQEDVTMSGRKAHNKNGESPMELVPPSQALSAGRSAREELTVPRQTKELKGVLTPIKRGRGRPRKNVAFEDDRKLDLGFRDLPDPATLKKLKTSKLIVSTPHAVPYSKGANASEANGNQEEESGSEEEDDIACARCSGFDSEKSNPIVLCDNCDSGLHLKCLNLKKLPKGSWACPDCAPKPKPDDIYCRICSRPDYTNRNQIILCETCDYGIHLDCSDMKEVPEDEWFCPECKPEPETSVATKMGSSAQAACKFPAIEGFENHLSRLQRVLLDKLTGQKRIKPIGHDDEMQKVYQVVEQTILAGEGNSMLIIGARGAGKTTLVDTVVSDLSRDHRENFHVVRLNGFIHTDDKLALKEIWRQLGREMEVEDETTGKSNYADTLASLLALLSHPSEMGNGQSDQTAKSVVFILDEFDLFTTHSRQTLLYNLFDIAQARKAPIVVLGLTTRIDVVESLEKRVKSRFSHRYVHLSLPRSVPAFWEICKEGLTVDARELDAGNSDTNPIGQDEFLSFWQTMIEDLYEKDAKFKHHIQSQFYRSKSVPSFFTSCILPIANITPTNIPLTGNEFTTATQSLAPPDSKLRLLQGLSDLELALLIAAARLDIIQDTDTCNFAMAYDEYSSLTSRHKIQTSSTGVAALGASAKVWGRDVALGAWERLADYALLVPAGIGGGAARDFSAGGRMWKVDVGLEEITGSVDSLSTVMTKWCREI